MMTLKPFTTTSLNYFRLEKRWNIPDLKQGSTHISKIQELLKVDRVIASLLYQRNLLEYEQIKTFFRPELTQLHDPFLMKGMSVDIDRITKAVQNKEKILVYGDYDVDGTTAVSLVY